MDTVEKKDKPEELRLRKMKKTKKKKPLWTTTTIAATIGREELLAATFQEILFHLVSLIFLSIYIFSQTNNSEYYLTETLKSAFNVEEGLLGVTSAEDFWEYTKTNMVEQFYGPEGTTRTDLIIRNENLVLGVPRIRQVKVTSSSCEIHGYFRRLFASCYYNFEKDSEDRHSFGLERPTAWVFSNAAKTKSLRYWGTLTSYSGGGFYLDFPLKANETIDMLGELEDNLWITQGTRAVFLDFSVYNANLNLFCVCKIIFEFLPTGGVTPNFRFTPSTLTPFPTVWNWILRILLYLFCIYMLYCLCEEIREIMFFGARYFAQFWNYVDITAILLTGLLLVSTEYMRVVMGSYIEQIHRSHNQYGNLETPRVIDQVVKIGGATLLFVIYLRTFKYLNFNRRMAQLNNTLRNCAKDILGFSVMFFVAYFAYAELGYLVFGSEVDDFRSFGQAMFTLLRTILGDFDYSKIHDANWVVAPIYFLSYIILVFFILLNMFLAIINDTYADVKTDIAIAPKEMEMTEYISQKTRRLLKMLGCRVREEREKQTLINANIKQIRDALVKCDYGDREIALYFTRYDIDPFKDLSREELEKFHDLLLKEDLAKQQGEENVVTWKDFERQDNKLVELENSLVALGDKVHELLQALRATSDAEDRPILL